MTDLSDILTRTISPHFTLWLALLVGTCVVLAGHRFVQSRKLLVQLPGPPSGNWLMGHFNNMMDTDGVRIQKDFITKYGPTIRLNGSLGEEFVYTVDPAVMHSVLVKDKAKFKRGDGSNLILRSLFGGGLLPLEGEEHRVHRKLLTPVFTMKFLRELMPIFTNIAKQTCQGIQKELNASKNTAKTIDVFPWATSAALELIGEAGLGYSFNSFSGKRDEYNESIKIVTQTISVLSPYVNLLPYLYRIGTPALRGWVLDRVPWVTIRQLSRIVGIQNKQADEVLRERQALIDAGDDLSSQAGRGRDIMTLLLKANEAAGSQFYIDRQAMVGHMNLFVFAGHETTSTAVARILELLSTNQHIQNKLRDEVCQYFKENPDDAHHDGLLELPYLDGVVRETLRLYGPASFISRECAEDTILPLAYPIDTPTGKITSLPVKKGNRVYMSITISGQYERIWGERAEEFLPERWIGARLDEVSQPGANLPGVYSSIMTFGAGPTSCIGFKFAVMEIKVMIAQLVKSFKFEPSEEAVYWQPFAILFPYLKRESDLPGKLPKLPLKVMEL